MSYVLSHYQTESTESTELIHVKNLIKTQTQITAKPIIPGAVQKATIAFVLRSLLRMILMSMLEVILGAVVDAVLETVLDAVLDGVSEVVIKPTADVILDGVLTPSPKTLLESRVVIGQEEWHYQWILATTKHDQIKASTDNDFVIISDSEYTLPIDDDDVVIIAVSVSQ